MAGDPIQLPHHRHVARPVRHRDIHPTRAAHHERAAGVGGAPRRGRPSSSGCWGGGSAEARALAAATAVVEATDSAVDNAAEASAAAGGGVGSYCFCLRLSSTHISVHMHPKNGRSERQPPTANREAAATANRERSALHQPPTVKRQLHNTLERAAALWAAAAANRVSAAGATERGGGAFPPG